MSGPGWPGPDTGSRQESVRPGRRRVPSSPPLHGSHRRFQEDCQTLPSMDFEAVASSAESTSLTLLGLFGYLFSIKKEMTFPKRSSSFDRFMNHRAPANSRYKPTWYEHAANCYTHAFLIVPAIVGSALLHRLSDDRWEKITAWIYGMGLCALFIVSTVFHIVSWKKSHLRTMEHCFHMCDRIVIYIFIASSYAPWLNLRELGPLASHMRWFIWLMAAGGTVYVFLYHEKITLMEFMNWPGEESFIAWEWSFSRVME
ncbi:monocyte to macrophage differentiation factor isoform X3 [Rhinatrema bivittatum]|uniref:monocyte to macrophage differentiation factor isoform X3 n=1 Tax=Rhinatrema bivittatum TaxID=194408 RepID=UPI001128B01D|nr:monocyte to macrophage differentiation factor isoform X3 [Rhinatrema bivittatum]